MADKLIEISENIKNENKKMKEYIYIGPDDRNLINVGNYIKYINTKYTNIKQEDYYYQYHINKSSRSEILMKLQTVQNRERT